MNAGNLLTDEEQTRGTRDVLLQRNTKNITDCVCEQRERFKGNRNKNTYSKRFKKRRLYSVGHRMRTDDQENLTLRRYILKGKVTKRNRK